MIEAGLWATKSQRRRFHQPRIRRECYGELIQIDSSEHRWFEERGPRCTLLVFAGLSGGAWPSVGVLFRQALGVPHSQKKRPDGREHDAVWPRPRRASD